MSNSYVYNEEYGMDGESMSDWYTGSATVLVKVLIRCVFSINVTLDAVTVKPCVYFPAAHARVKIPVRNAVITVEYRKTGQKRRRITVNGKHTDGAEITLPFDVLPPSVEIIVED